MAVNQMSKRHHVEPVLSLDKYMWFFVTKSFHHLKTKIHDLLIFKVEALTKWQINVFLTGFLKIKKRKHTFICLEKQ